MFFEIDDVKRRSSGYFDIYNVHGWIDAPENTLSWNYTRGVMAALPAIATGEILNLARANYDVLTRHYDKPRNFDQARIYARELLNMENFRKGLRTRLGYAGLLALGDLGPRLALWRYYTAGLYRGDQVSINFEFWRGILPTIAVAALTSGFSVPFENARAAFFADRTYPAELRKNYTSIGNALKRIPSEEGVYYLFKGASPIMARNYCLFSVSVYMYDFMRDWFYLIREEAHGGELGRFGRVATPAAIAAFLGCVFACPWDNYARYLVEYVPKGKDGKHPYNFNYRKALVETWFLPQRNNYWVGFTNFAWRHGPYTAIMLYLAENMGLFSRWKHSSMLMAGNNDTDNNYQ